MTFANTGRVHGVEEVEIERWVHQGYLYGPRRSCGASVSSGERSWTERGLGGPLTTRKPCSLTYADERDLNLHKVLSALACCGEVWREAGLPLSP